jgi:hypothetical protein
LLHTQREAEAQQQMFRINQGKHMATTIETNPMPSQGAYVGSTLGVSMTAAMLLAACGGSDPVSQPAWGSMAVLVAPGQANKTFTFADGSCAAGEGEVALFNASFEVAASGNVSFKAATTSGGAVSERFSLAQSDTKYRRIRLSGDEGAVSYARYDASNSPGDFEMEDYKSISLEAGEGDDPGRLAIYNYAIQDTFYDIRCTSGPLSVAGLTPAVMPSEQRAASAFFAGANAADTEGGSLIWSESWPGSQMIEGLNPVNAINLGNGQWFYGYQASSSAPLATSPSPIRVLFSGLFQGGEYSETYSAANEEEPEIRTLNVSIYGQEEDTQDLRVSRLGNVLAIGNYIK